MPRKKKNQKYKKWDRKPKEKPKGNTGAERNNSWNEKFSDSKANLNRKKKESVNLNIQQWEVLNLRGKKDGKKMNRV